MLLHSLSFTFVISGPFGRLVFRLSAHWYEDKIVHDATFEGETLIDKIYPINSPSTKNFKHILRQTEPPLIPFTRPRLRAVMVLLKLIVSSFSGTPLSMLSSISVTYSK